MPHNSSRRKASVTRLVLFTLAGWVYWAVGREPDESPAATDPWELDVELDESTGRRRPERRGFNRRRLATTLAFTTLFFAGAAFSAGAGDLVVEAVEGDTTTETTTTTEEGEGDGEGAEAPAEEPAAEEPAPEEPASEPAPEEPGEGPDEPAEEPEPDPASEDDEGTPEDPDAASGGDGDGGAQGGSQGGGGAPAPAGEDDGEASQPEPRPLSGKDPGGGAAHDVEGELHDHSDDPALATVWLNAELPDPTPPAKRLAPKFARQLRAAAAAHDVDWALVLGYLRARGHDGRFPATEARVDRAAAALAGAGTRDDWRALLAVSGETTFADKASALTNYNRAVGLRALVTGLEAAQKRLEHRLLRDERLDVYAGGRFDVASGKVDVRVLALLLYMAEAHEQVTVSSLRSGHRYYSRPGVVSRHVYGLAVDIAVVEGRSILGNQEPGGVTERAVRNILNLPAELRPRQVISLLGLGGPSFPMGDHHDHIHVGY